MLWISTLECQCNASAAWILKMFTTHLQVFLWKLNSMTSHGLDSFSPGFEPFPSRPISQELSDSMGLGSPHGGEGRRPRSGRRNLLKATGRCPVRVTGRFFYSVPRAPPSCLISRLSFWKPTQLAWAEWPAVAAHLPRGSPP